MFAQISQTSGAQQSISDSMAQDVGVGEAQKPFFEWNLNSAQNKLSALL